MHTPGLRELHLAPPHPELLAAFLGSFDAPHLAARPRVVVVPSVALGRALVRRLAMQHGAACNVRTLTWSELALALTARERSIEHRRLLGIEARAWLVQRLHGRRDRSASYFDAVLSVRGFRAVLGWTFEELARAGLASTIDVERLLVRHGFDLPLRARHVLELYLAYRRSFEATHDDAASLLTRASQAPPGRTTAVLGPHVDVYGFVDLAQVERRLLDSLGDDADLELRAFVPRVEPFASPLAAWLESRGYAIRRPAPVSPAPSPPELRVISAPSAEAEADEIVRQLLIAVDAGMRFGRMAIVVRTAQRLELLRSVLRRRGIPSVFHPGAALQSIRTGRALLYFLELLDGRFDPAATLAFLAVAPLRARDWVALEGDVSPSAWERVARETHLEAGIEDWRTKLGCYIEEQKRTAERLEREEDPAQRARASARAAHDLLQIAEGVAGEIERFPKRGHWSDLVEATHAVLARVFDPGSEVETMRQALERLRALDRLAASGPSRVEFREAVRDLLSDAVLEEGGSAIDAVLVGTATALHGQEFDLVCLAGVQEGEWPGRPQQDPVLRESERRVLAACGAEAVQLPSAEEHIERDRWLFRSWCGAARRRLVLAYARLDPVTGAQCLPSPLVLAMAEEREGRPVDYETLESLAWVERVPLRRTSFPEELPALGLDELDTAAALGLPGPAARRYVRGLGDCARRGWMLDHLRNHVARFTSVDGVLSGRAARAALATRFARPSVSASQLSNFTTCPFRYFMRYLLRVEPLDRDDRRQLSGLEFGRLAHRILERFYTELDRDGRTLQETDDTELAARVHAAQTPVFSEAEQQGRTGARLLWSIHKQRLEEDLRQFLRCERQRGSTAFRPLRFEARFGRGTPWPVSLQTTVGDTIDLHGSIDRVDEEPRSGAIRVIDYKTGRLNVQASDSGAIQLALYVWAATGGDARRLAASQGELVSVTRKGGFGVRRLAGALLWEHRVDLERLTASLVDGGRAGHFLPDPGPEAVHCKACDYANLCEARVAEQVAAKADDARLVAFRHLPKLSDLLETLSAGEAAAAGEEGDDA